MRPAFGGMFSTNYVQRTMVGLINVYKWEKNLEFAKVKCINYHDLFSFTCGFLYGRVFGEAWSLGIKDQQSQL